MRSLLKWLVLAAVVVIPLELLGFAAGKVLARAGLIYDPAPVQDYARYLARRDPLLGWPSQENFGRGEYDASGSRIVPAFPDPSAGSCVALFGDSFTWSHDVGPEDAYGNVLARRLGCRVANYGVGGYGTDQALLRYQQAIKDPAPIVILGHYSENIIRNINQERGFFANETLGLKPRYVIDAGGLRLVPLPKLTEAEYRDLPRRAAELLPHEYFVPGGPSGIGRMSFPYSVSALGVVRHWRVQGRLQGRPSYERFYDPAHPSQALQVTEAIIRGFADEAKARGQKAMVLLVPDYKDLTALRDRGVLPYAELAERLRNAGLVVPKVAEQFSPDLSASALCRLFTNCHGGHYTAAGYARLGEIAFAALVEAGWVGAGSGPRP
jgi:hypothetical protein